MKRWWWLAVVVLAALMVPGRPVAATGLHYAVAAELPSNQVNTGVSYFALQVAPGAVQQVHVTITNKDTVAHRYRVSVNRAATNTNGVIDYTHHGLRPSASLQADIEAMTSAPFTVAVAAQTARTVAITVRVPKKAFAGVAVGGIRISEQAAGKQASAHEDGLQLHNQFAYVIGLTLQETARVDQIKPVLRLRSVAAKQLNYRNCVLATLTNTQPNPLHQLKLAAKLTKDGAKAPFLTYTKAKMAMAPNSDFRFPISTLNHPLQAGRYQLALTATAGQYRWHFHRRFTITAAQARRLNHTAVDQKRAAVPWGLWLLLALGGLLVVALGAVLWLLRPRRKR